jgi:hypothetical protein
VRADLEFISRGLCYYLFIKYYPLKFLIFRDERVTDIGQKSLFMNRKIRACAQVHSIQGPSALLSPRSLYLLTPWSRFLLEKLTGLQLIKKFPAFYATRRFITSFTVARHPSLSLASSIQSIPHIPFPKDPP